LSAWKPKKPFHIGEKGPREWGERTEGQNRKSPKGEKKGNARSLWLKKGSKKRKGRPLRGTKWEREGVAEQKIPRMVKGEGKLKRKKAL